MAITTRLTPYYKWKTLAVAVLCIVFGVWGAYDFFIAIPEEQRAYDRVQALEAQQREIEEDNQSSQPHTAEVIARYDANKAELLELKADGEPVAPAGYDRPVQIMFMLCFPFGLWYLWIFLKEKNQTYTLDDEGNLHTPQGTVAAQDIKDIDMSRWMAKSIAHVETNDGRRIKLDDYVQKQTHLIVGKLAHERYPDQWHEDARQVKPVEQEAHA